MNKQSKKLQIDQYQLQSPTKFLNLKNDKVEAEQQLDQYTIFDNSKQMNIKEHIDKLFNILTSIKDDLKISRDNMNLIKEDLQKLQSNQYREEDRITKLLLSDLNKQKNELKKQQITTQTAYISFSKQITSLQNDKDFISENTIQVQSNTNSIEIQIGFRTVYDI